MILILSASNVYSQSKFSIGFSGILGQGTDNGTALDYWGGKSYESCYGLGVNIEYSVSESFHIFFDGNFYSMKVFQADGGETVYSLWAYEQSDYTDGNITLPTDVYYYTTSTMFRIGGKYLYPINEKIKVWYGAGVGFCGWMASYDTEDRTKTYGNDNDFLFAPFYQMVGIDYKVKENMKLTFFFDGGSPVAEVRIENLFFDGWTWDAEKHIMPPYRIGLTFFMAIGY